MEGSSLQVFLLALALSSGLFVEAASLDQDISFSLLNQGRTSSSLELSNTSDTVTNLQVTAIFVHESEFPLSDLLFRLTLRLALESANERLRAKQLRLLLNIRSANTCSRQYAAAVAAEEFHLRRARLFIVSGCDDAIRAVSRFASNWQVPVMTAAGFGLDLDNKTIHKHLTRVAFSLRTAVEFLMKIFKSLQWRRVNLIVDESDANSVSLKASIDKHLADASSSEPDEFQVSLNVIPVAFRVLARMSLNQSMNETYLLASAGEQQTARSKRLSSSNDSGQQQVQSAAKVDQWADPAVELSVRESLKQSSSFSRINILLIPSSQVRKFMLVAHELGMANGHYSFIALPLLISAADNQEDAPSAGSQASSTGSQHGYAGESTFVWYSASSSRNAQARRAYESLMSIYLRTPTTKAYIYFANRLMNLVNSAHDPTIANASSPAKKPRLDINPYSASFYDCLQIYATVLEEFLTTRGTVEELNHRSTYANVSEMMKNRRFTNMVTGTITINANGDRETDYTLDDLNQQTGRFNPVILYKGDTRDIERLGRIHWSSDSSVGQTADDIDCQLVGTCPSRPLPRFLITLIMLFVPTALLVGIILFIVYRRMSLESQLVDHWWKISQSDIEFLITRRKALGETGDGLLVSSQAVRVTSSDGANLSKSEPLAVTNLTSAPSSVTSNSGLPRTTVTKVTMTGVGKSSSAADLCYGVIGLGIYRLNKVAIKPMAKLHQSRKLMIELRTIKDLEHANLCRFIGLIIDEPNLALVSEYCSKGSLREFFNNEIMCIDWTFRYSIMNDILAGLSFIHSSNIEYHGRLKSSNCLVSSRFVIKLSDYGLKSLYEQLDEHESEEDLAKKQIYLAPEHLRASGSSLTGSKKGDLYSLGLLLYEIITSTMPFYDQEKGDYKIAPASLIAILKSKGICEETGPDLSTIETSGEDISALLELMKQCWHFEPTKRPSLLVVNTAMKRITRGITSKKLLENLTSRMEQYTNNLESLVDAKLATLIEEKQKTEELLYQFVPKSIIPLLKQGQWVEPEAFACVTVFYSDIVGFTSLSSISSPIEVIDFLSDLYLCFDETLENYDIFKVETIGDAYIVASGLPQRNENRHVIEIACAALDLRDKLRTFKIPHVPGRSLEMRVGIHSGPCVAGIVGGIKMPKYCVFGDTLTMGKFMESSGLPMKIHITSSSRDLLEGIDSFIIEAREPKVSQDGVPIETFWLERREQG